jgi:ribose transport system permease protein/inositol transport system permease protein
MPLAGGRGSMLGVVGGVLVMGLLGRVLPLVPGIGQDQQFVIRGLIFVAVVGISQYALRRSGRDDR